MNIEKCKQLKEDLFDFGREYIEEFLGYEYPRGEDVGITDARIDATIRDMDDETLEDVYLRLCMEQDPCS